MSHQLQIQFGPNYQLEIEFGPNYQLQIEFFQNYQFGIFQDLVQLVYCSPKTKRHISGRVSGKQKLQQINAKFRENFLQCFANFFLRNFVFFCEISHFFSNMNFVKICGILGEKNMQHNVCFFSRKKNKKCEIFRKNEIDLNFQPNHCNKPLVRSYHYINLPKAFRNYENKISMT